MDESRIRELLLSQYGLRVKPEMAKYISGRLISAPQAPLPVIAGDARTGVAVRQVLSGAELLAALSATPSVAAAS
jgi:hypothetical protein